MEIKISMLGIGMKKLTLTMTDSRQFNLLKSAATHKVNLIFSKIQKIGMLV